MSKNSKLETLHSVGANCKSSNNDSRNQLFYDWKVLKGWRKTIDRHETRTTWHHLCLRSSATCGKTPTAVTFFKSELFLPCGCYAIKTNIRTICSHVSQPASAVKGADLVNCKLVTAWHQNSELRLGCFVSVIPSNKTAIARIKSVKLPTSGFWKFFIVSLNFQQMPVWPPLCRRPWLVGQQVGPFQLSLRPWLKTYIVMLELLVKLKPAWNRGWSRGTIGTIDSLKL